MMRRNVRPSRPDTPSLLGGQLVAAMFDQLRALGADARGSSRPEAAPGERVYAIGDVHGRLDLLRSLLRTLDADAAGLAREATRIVFLGDLIDRGPHSRQVLELVRFLQRRDPERVVVLLGNHEAMLLAAVEGDPSAQRMWLKTGGDDTLRSYRIDPAEFVRLTAAKRAGLLRRTIGPKMIAWLEARPLAWRSGGYFFCHAGVRPGVSLDKQRREDLLWIRREFLDSTSAHGAVVVHGHSETEAAQAAPNRINVDTGAWRSGELTAVGLQGPFRWFVSTAHRYLNRGDLDAALARRAGQGESAELPLAVGF